MTRPEYEPDEGRVVLSRYWDGAVREAAMVRAGIEEAAIRDAAIEELRRLGYTVIAPGGDTPSDRLTQGHRT